MQRTVNHDDMRSANMESVFDCIRAHAPVTKRQIQSLTGLSWGSVSNLCSILLERGVLRELPVRTEGAGRNPSGFDINLKDNLIIGLDVNLSGLTGVVCDLRSRVLARVWRPTEGRKGEDILRLMKEAAAELLGQTAAGTVKGLAIAFPGQVDAERGVSLWTHQFGSLSEVNMREIFQRAFGLEVLLEHDPNCMAVCEHWMGAAQDVEDFLFVRLSYGIGMGILTGGAVYRGHSGASGEIGHMTMLPDGEPCCCGNRGCLETVASVDAILRRCRELAADGRAPLLASIAADGPITLEAAARAARQGDRAVAAVVSRAADYAGIAVANVVNIIDPAAVVIGGELAAYPDLCIERLRETVGSRAWSGPVDLRVSSLGGDSAAIGAAAMFIRRVFFRISEEQAALGGL